MICKTWRKWQVSDGKVICEHKAPTEAEQYCCIKASDFYEYATTTLADSNSCFFKFGTPPSVMQPYKNGVKVVCGDHELYGDIGFDSTFSEGIELSDGVYQCFAGATVSCDEAIFDNDTAGLMLELKASETRHGVLVSVTIFLK